MKNIIALLSICILFASCDLNKYTTVHIQNKNNYPLEVSIKTNNIENIYLVAANSNMDTLRKWTDIEREDGEWDVTLKNANTNQGKNYKHGHYFKGDLSTHFTVINKGSFVQFSVDN